MKILLISFLIASCTHLPSFGTRSIASSESGGDFQFDYERERMLELIKSPPQAKYEITNLSTASEKNQRLSEYFTKEFLPITQELERLDIIVSTYHVAIDRALFLSEDEKKSWEQIKLTNENRYSEILASKEYKDAIKMLYDLSTGLAGELPDFANRIYKDDQIFGITPADLPIVNKISELETEIRSVANKSPVAAKLGATEKQVKEIYAKFYKGELSFTDATTEIEKLVPANYEALGLDVAKNGGKLIDQVAVLRTELAKKKGFKNWADYTLAQHERYYRQEMKLPADRIEFLKSLLAKTKITHDKFIHWMAKKYPGVDVKNLRYSQVALLKLETETLLKDYFKIDRVADIWKATMLDSGFPEEVFNNISLDSYPRENKQSHAYMANVVSHKPRVLTLDAGSLSLKASNDWNPARIFIVQNLRTDGINNFSTAFHEGGHALDYSYREDLWDFGQTSAYTETHSMTMEQFFEDHEYLRMTSQNEKGEMASPELISKYITNFTLNEIQNFRAQLLFALLDLEIWNHDYTQSKIGMTERIAKTYADLQKKYWFGHEGRTIHGIDVNYRPFSTNHFYGGAVRYIGYVYATIASQMSYDALLEKLGVKTLYKQPGVAKLLTEGYYRTGFLQPFPEATERFTGKKFDANTVAKELDDKVTRAIEQGN